MKESEQIKAIGELLEIEGHKIHVYRAGGTDKPKLVFLSGSGTVAPVYDFKILYEKLVSDFRIIVIEKSLRKESKMVQTKKQHCAFR